VKLFDTFPDHGLQVQRTADAASGPVYGLEVDLEDGKKRVIGYRSIRRQKACDTSLYWKSAPSESKSPMRLKISIPHQPLPRSDGTPADTAAYPEA
jgi:hypothetical protein